MQEYDEEHELEDDTELLDEEGYDEKPRADRLQILKQITVSHPRLFVLGSSLATSLVIDLFTRFDPLFTILGLGGAIALGAKGEDILTTFIPGADPEEADRVANQLLPDDYPIYVNQSPVAKFKRLIGHGDYRTVEEPAQNIRALPRNREVKKSPVVAGQQDSLSFDKIIDWFERGVIDDTQLIRLLEHLTKSYGSGSGNGNDVIDEHEAASEEVGSTQIESLRPPDWSEETEHRLIGAYLALGAQSKSIIAIGLADGQRNRDYARVVLKRNGFLKGTK